jgi:sulfide:quinone oxidoreductase
VADLKVLGFKTLINNRPDEEAPYDARAEAMKKAAEEAGLTYVHAPFVGQPTGQAIEAAAKAAGPAIAYCRSGTRSVTAWAMAQAQSGRLNPDAIIDLARGAGYDLVPLKDLLRSLGSK